MASRAVESNKLSGLHWAKALYFVFILFILKAKFLKYFPCGQTHDLAVLVKSTELSQATVRPICYIQCYHLLFFNFSSIKYLSCGLISFIKDSLSIWQSLLQKFPHGVSPGTKLFSMDATSMYTNINTGVDINVGVNMNVDANIKAFAIRASQWAQGLRMHLASSHSQ